MPLAQLGNISCPARSLKYFQRMEKPLPSAPNGSFSQCLSFLSQKEKSSAQKYDWTYFISFSPVCTQTQNHIFSFLDSPMCLQMPLFAKLPMQCTVLVIWLHSWLCMGDKVMPAMDLSFCNFECRACFR